MKAFALPPSHRIFVATAAAGGGVERQFISFGGYTGGAGYYLDARGPSSGGSSTGRDAETSNLAEFDGTVTSVHLTLGLADSGQVFAVWVNDVEVATFSPAVVLQAEWSGVITIVPAISLSAGDKVNLKMKTSNCGDTGVTLVLEGT